MGDIYRVIFVVAVMMEWDFTMDEKGYFDLFTKKENQPKKTAIFTGKDIIARIFKT